MPARYVDAIRWPLHARRSDSGSRGPRYRSPLRAITQAGGWKSPMPLQYAEKINVGRSGMARAAEKTGRDL